MAELDIESIKKDWKAATEGLASFRTEAKESYDFAAGHQWTDEDIATLEDEFRPAVTFDRIGVFVDAVCGMEINNRQAIKYFPVEQGDVKLNETLTNSVKYFENDCGAEDEDSEAVRDTTICGIGCTETILSTDAHPDGAPVVLRRDPLTMWFDPNANKRNLADMRFVFHGDWMPLEEAKDRWGDANFGAEGPSDTSSRHLADRAFEYKEDAQLDNRKGEVFVLHYQCYKREDVYRLRDPQTGEVSNFTKSSFAAAKKLYMERYGREPVLATKSSPNGDYVKSTKKVFYRAFVSGNEILEQDKLPVEDFTFKFITFKRDRNKRVWYGLVRVMKDPQKWANKWLSQILHIVNTNAKGGAFVEVGALADPRAIEEQWAQANPLIKLKEGGINKIRERTQSQYPSGLDRLMQFAFNALPMVSGLNLEVIGLADREQAGVLESERKKTAFTILAPLFAAVREYRRARGKLMLGILKFIPQGTLVKIAGERGEQWVPFVYKDTEYDVKVDQAPDSPDYKQKVWETLGTIIPAMMKAGYPIPPEILLQSPLPSDISEAWVQWIKQQGWMPPEHRQQMEQMSQQLQQLGQENMKLTEQNMMLRLDHSADIGKLQLKAKEGDDKNAVKVYQAQLAAMTAKIESAVQEQRNTMEAVLEAEKQKLEERVKAVEIVAKTQIESAKAQLKAYELSLKEREIKEDAKEKARSNRKVSVKRVQDGVYRIEPE